MNWYSASLIAALVWRKVVLTYRQGAIFIRSTLNKNIG